MEGYAMSCLNVLADIITSSDRIMDFFASLPGVTYQYARYSDWISPFLNSQLNKTDSANYSYSYSTSKEDIVKVMSKFEIYDAFIKKKDSESSPDQNDAAQ